MDRKHKNREDGLFEYDCDDEALDPEDLPGGSESTDQRQKGPLSLFPSVRHAHPAIVLFIMFFIVSVLAQKYELQNRVSVNFNGIFLRHEYWRLLTALFAHQNIFHLVSNGFLFILFGWMLRAYFGFLLFPVLSLVIGMITNLIISYIYEPGVSVVGASGMVFGMVALWIVFYIRYDIDRSIALRIIRTIGFVLIVLFPSAVDPQTSYLSHAVGFIAGLVAGLVLNQRINVRDPK